MKAKKTVSVVVGVLLALAIIGCVNITKVQAAPVSITAKSLMLKKGQSYTLKLKNAKSVKWSSSSKKVAVVKNGKVTAKKAGYATITAKSGKKTYKCSVTVTSGKKKALVVYFSATGTTKKAAQKVRKAADADILRILPKKNYTDADLEYWNDCRANREQDANTYVAISTVIRNLKQYDTVYLGYPIWHGKEPGVIRTFLKNNSLKGRNVIPFCTSGSSGISGSMADIRSLAKGADVGNGKDLTDASAGEIKKWITSSGGTLK